MKLKELLDKIVNRQEDHNATLIRLTEAVEYHIKRTDLLEKQVNKIQSDVEDVENHVIMVNGFVKYFGILVAVVAGMSGFVISIYKLALWLKGIV